MLLLTFTYFPKGIDFYAYYRFTYDLCVTKPFPAFATKCSYEPLRTHYVLLLANFHQLL